MLDTVTPPVTSFNNPVVGPGFGFTENPAATLHKTASGKRRADYTTYKRDWDSITFAGLTLAQRNTLLTMLESKATLYVKWADDTSTIYTVLCIDPIKVKAWVKAGGTVAWDVTFKLIAQ